MTEDQRQQELEWVQQKRRELREQNAWLSRELVTFRDLQERRFKIKLWCAVMVFTVAFIILILIANP